MNITNKNIIWYGYTVLSANGCGFWEIGRYSARLSVAEFYVSEFDEPDDLGNICAIRLETTSNCPSFAPIACKSKGQALHILQSKKPLQMALDLGYKSQYSAAARDALEKLTKRAESQFERQSYTRESAVKKLIESGILPEGYDISQKVWNKSQTKKRVLAALSGDPNAMGCLRRDCNNK